MSFGFSVGDVIFCSKLAFNAYTALKDAPSEFEGLRLEVLSLNATLRALAEEANSPNSIILLASPQRQESLRVLLENCSKGLQQLQVLTSKFPTLGSPEKRKFLEHVKFSLQNKNGPRDKLAIHTASINIFLTSLTHSSLGRLEGLIKNALRGSAQKQQGVQTQFASAGYTNHIVLGDRSEGFNALSSDLAGAQTASSEPDVWANIGQDLGWEGIRAQDVNPFRDEIVTYVRYLHNGGEPFWKRGSSRIEQDAMRKGRTLQSAGRSEHEMKRENVPRTSINPPSQDIKLPPYSETPPLSQPGAFGSTISYDEPRLVLRAPRQERTSPSRNSKGNDQKPSRRTRPRPQYQPTVEDATDSSDEPRPAKNDGSGNDSSDDVHAIKGPTRKPTHEIPDDPSQSGRDQVAPPNRVRFKEPEAYTKPEQVDVSTLELELEVERLKREIKEEKEKRAKEEEERVSKLTNPFLKPLIRPGDTEQKPAQGLFGNQPDKTTQPVQPSGGFGHASTSNTASSGFGAPSSGSSQFGNKNTTTSGSLFGGNTSTTPATSEGLFGNAGSVQLGPDFSGRDSGTQKPSLFGQPQVNDEEVDEMANLFDHMFDVDETEAVIAQGMEEDRYYQRSDDVRPTHGYNRPSQVPGPPPIEAVVNPPPSPRRPPEAGTRYESYPQSGRGVGFRRASEFRMPPPLRRDDPPDIRDSCLSIARAQLETLLNWLDAAQKDGNLALVHSLLNSTMPDRESLIHERVTYLRGGGAVVVNCDICSAPVLDMHWHCDTCSDGDWDCCGDCKMRGYGCPGKHRLAERSAKMWAGRRYWTNFRDD